MLRNTFYFCLVGVFVTVIAQPNCQQPGEINCDNILSYYRCLGYGLANDCKKDLGAYYWRIDNSLSWDDAKTVCRSLPGADLISIHSVNEFYLLESLWVNRQNNRWAWVGSQCPQPNVNCQTSERTWSDGSPTDYNLPWLTDQQCPIVYLEHAALGDVLFKVGQYLSNTGPQTIQTKAVFSVSSRSQRHSSDGGQPGICQYPGDEKDVSTVCKLKY